MATKSSFSLDGFLSALFFGVIFGLLIGILAVIKEFAGLSFIFPIFIFPLCIVLSFWIQDNTISRLSQNFRNSLRGLY